MANLRVSPLHDDRGMSGSQPKLAAGTPVYGPVADKNPSRLLVLGYCYQSQPQLFTILSFEQISQAKKNLTERSPR